MATTQGIIGVAVTIVTVLLAFVHRRMGRSPSRRAPLRHGYRGSPSGFPAEVRQQRSGLLLVVAALAAPPLAAQDLPEIVSRGSLRVLASADEHPSMFNWWTGVGEPGLEREMVESFARLHRLKLEPVKVKRFELIIPALLEGKGDVIIGIIDTPERRERIDFTVEVLPARHVVVTREPHPIVESLEQFRKEKVGTVHGTTWWRAALAGGIPEADLTAFADRPAMFEALQSGKITATVMSISDFTLAAKQDGALRGGIFVGESASAAFGLRKEDSRLHAALNEYLTHVRKSQTWSRLIVKYFGNEALKVLGRGSTKWAAASEPRAHLPRRGATKP